MACSVCILVIRKSVLSWIAILLIFSVFSTFSGNEVILSTTVTSLILIFFTFIFTFSKQNPVILEEVEPVQKNVFSLCSSTQQQDLPKVEKPVQEKVLISPEEQYLPQIIEESEEQYLAQTIEESEEQTLAQTIEESAPENDLKIEAVDHGVAQIRGFLVRSNADLCSESDSINHSYSSAEESDIYWPHSDNLSPSPECSDDSISDEESLIEIALPSGHYVGPKQDPKSHIRHHHKFQDISSDKLFLAEIINEMINEEESLIEIDLNVGSIKCSRFEIEA